MIRYCRTCGAKSTSPRCGECGAGSEAPAVPCVPAPAPVPGYISFSQLASLARAVELSPEPAREEAAKPGLSLFAFSMGLVKWLGVIVTCLILAFFLIAILKAFAS